MFRRFSLMLTICRHIAYVRLTLLPPPRCVSARCALPRFYAVDIAARTRDVDAPRRCALMPAAHAASAR